MKRACAPWCSACESDLMRSTRCKEGDVFVFIGRLSQETLLILFCHEAPSVSRNYKCWPHIECVRWLGEFAGYKWSRQILPFTRFKAGRPWKMPSLLKTLKARWAVHQSGKHATNHKLVYKSSISSFMQSPSILKVGSAQFVYTSILNVQWKIDNLFLYCISYELIKKRNRWKHQFVLFWLWSNVRD